MKWWLPKPGQEKDELGGERLITGYEVTATGESSGVLLLNKMTIAKGNEGCLRG